MTKLWILAACFTLGLSAQVKDASPRTIANGASDPVTCSIGDLFVNTASVPALKLATSTGPCVWTAQGGAADPTNGLFLLEDNFPATRSDIDPCCQIAWHMTGGTLSTVLQSSATAAHPGVKAMTTGAVSGNSLNMDFAYGGTGTNFYSLASGIFTRWEHTNTVLLDNAAGIAGISNIGYAFGSSLSAAGCGGGGWCIAANTTAPVSCTIGATNGVTSVAWNPANWMYVMTISGGAVVCLDSGVAAMSGTWYVLKISYLASNTTTTYTIDGAASRTIPSSPPSTIQNPFMNVITRTSSAKIAWQDHWKFIGWY